MATFYRHHYRNQVSQLMSIYFQLKYKYGLYGVGMKKRWNKIPREPLGFGIIKCIGCIIEFLSEYIVAYVCH